MSPNPDALFALMYSSDAVGTPDRQVLEDILEEARAKNATLGITGILLFRRGKFFQYLEGSEANVRRVYASIAADPRHEHLKILLENTVESRRFAAWTMGYEPLREGAVVPSGFRSSFADLEDTRRPQHVLRAVAELTLWYWARASRTQQATD